MTRTYLVDIAGRDAESLRAHGTWVLLIAIATLPYLNALGNDLVYDDLAVTVENTLVRSLDPIPIFLAPSLPEHDIEWYRPLTIYTFALNHAAHGLEPVGYHTLNLLLHLANALLVFALARRLLDNFAGGLITASLFAVHPVHVEAVVPASGRADLLATFFVLSAWLLSIRLVEKLSFDRAMVIGSLFFAALLSKESAIVAWPVILLTDFAQLQNKARAESAFDLVAKRAYLHLALAGVVVAYFGLRYVATGSFLFAGEVAIRPIENPLFGVDLPARLATSIWVLLKYLSLLVVPLRLSADYSYNQIPIVGSAGDPRLLLATGVLLSVGAAAAVLRKRHPPLVYFSLLFLVMWLPISNTIVVIGTIMAERLMYLPSAAFCFIVGALAASFWPSRPRFQVLAAAAIATLLAACVVRTISRNRDWRSQETLFAATVRTAPRSAKAHFNYGTELLELGQPSRAAAEFEAALSITDRYPEAHSALGTVFMDKNDLPRAEAEFRAALRDDPAMASAWANLGMTLFRTDRYEEARHAFRRAVELRPQLDLAWATLGALAEREGKLREAIDYYWKAYDLNPNFEGLGTHLASLLAESGRDSEAQRLRRDHARRKSIPE